MAESLDRPLPDDLTAAADDLMRRLAGRGLRVATAESCTGGLLAALLTDIDGAAHAFDRGVVTYTDEAKQDLLGIEGHVVEPNEAVTESVARVMAQAIVSRSTADFGVGITGFAGPGAPGTEEGLVHLAVAVRGGATIHREEHFGPVGRGPIRTATLRVAVDMLNEVVAQGQGTVNSQGIRGSGGPDAT